jgi:hypothetical protein
MGGLGIWEPMVVLGLLLVAVKSQFTQFGLSSRCRIFSCCCGVFCPASRNVCLLHCFCTSLRSANTAVSRSQKGSIQLDGPAERMRRKHFHKNMASLWKPLIKLMTTQMNWQMCVARHADCQSVGLCVSLRLVFTPSSGMIF